MPRKSFPERTFEKVGELYQGEEVKRSTIRG